MRQTDTPLPLNDNYDMLLLSSELSNCNCNEQLIEVDCMILQARKLQERGWQPRWFRKDEGGCYHYIGGYWEAREQKNWDGIPDIFGQNVDPTCSIED